MVLRNIEGIDKDEISLGTYHVTKRTYIKGPKRGETVTRILQLRSKAGKRYWHVLKPSEIAPDGIPYPLAARSVEIGEPTAEDIRLFEQGNTITLKGASNLSGENPSSFFVLKRRKSGDHYRYYWSVPAELRKPRHRRKSTEEREEEEEEEAKELPRRAPKARKRGLIIEEEE